MNKPIDNKGGNQRLYQQVANKVLALINSGKYPAGSRLPAERELAETFGVGRPTIREAMVALETEGRVTVKIGAGVYALDCQSVSEKLGATTSPFELIEARVLIESEVTALAATMITDEELDQLAQALKEMEQENLQHNEGSTLADRKFHTIISQATRNKVFPVVIEQLWAAQEELEHIKLSIQAVCMSNSEARISEHTAIFNALVARDPQVARNAMRNHFSRLLSTLHETTEEQAVQEVRRKVSQNRKRFSIENLAKT